MREITLSFEREAKRDDRAQPISTLSKGMIKGLEPFSSGLAASKLYNTVNAKLHLAEYEAILNTHLHLTEKGQSRIADLVGCFKRHFQEFKTRLTGMISKLQMQFNVLLLSPHNLTALEQAAVCKNLEIDLKFMLAKAPGFRLTKLVVNEVKGEPVADLRLDRDPRENLHQAEADMNLGLLRTGIKQLLRGNKTIILALIKARGPLIFLT